MRRYRRLLQVSLLLVIAAFVVSSVVVFGSGTRDSGARLGDAIAVVNGERIPYDRYERAYRAYVNSYAQATRGQFTPQMAEQFGVPQQVVDALVQEALVVQRARAEGLEASDEEVNVQVHAIPVFQENGRFTRKRFDEVLKRAGLSETAFVTDVRRELTLRKVQGLVREGVKVSDAELQQAFVARNEEVRAAWALVELAPLVTAATASDAELDAYLKEHPAEFRLPERRRVQYVAFHPKDFPVNVPEADVEKYYTEHTRDWETPRQVKAAHVLVTVPPTGGSEAEDKARAKVAEVIRRARAGEDFGKLAREISEDPGSGPNGGDLGWVSRGDMVPQFEEPLFALGKGEISKEPVRTPFGFHAIKVSDVREGGRKTLKEVAPQIRQRLATTAAESAARAKAEELKPVLQAAPDFMAEARKLGRAPVETTISRIVQMPGRTDPLEEAAFALAVGGVSLPIQTPAGFVVLKNVEALPAAVPPLAEIKDKVATAVKRQKAELAALERAKKLAADAKGGDFAAAAKAAGAATGETPRFSRAKPAERLPGDAMLAALQTPQGDVTEPVKTQQGYYVLKVLSRVAPDPSALVAEQEKLSRDVLAQKQSQAWEAWLGAARAGAKIETNVQMLRPRRS
ncbi:MAG TPA: peptidyl-prolyl cis-trans isomerase [Methylomirabilota bacterium]